MYSIDYLIVSSLRKHWILFLLITIHTEVLQVCLFGIYVIYQGLYSCLPDSLDRAEASFQQSLLIAPKDGDTLYKYGYFLEKLRNKRQEGIEYYLKSLVVLPKHLNCMVSLAEAHSHPEGLFRVER